MRQSILSIILVCCVISGCAGLPRNECLPSTVDDGETWYSMTSQPVGAEELISQLPKTDLTTHKIVGRFDWYISEGGVLRVCIGETGVATCHDFERVGKGYEYRNRDKLIVCGKWCKTIRSSGPLRTARCRPILIAAAVAQLKH